MNRDDGSTDGPTLADPRAPRFGQSVTATGLLLGALTQRPFFVYAIGVILLVAVLSRWRLDVYAIVWTHLVIPVVGPPSEREPAPPHRFAKVLGATGATLSSVSLLAGYSGVGFGIALAVGALAGLAAATGICLGCRMYRQVSFLRRRGIV